MVRLLRRDASAIGNLGIFIVAVIIVVAILAVYYAYLVPAPASPTVRASLGDTVQIEYIGTFQDSGVVFDTSNASVAANNASFPKAFSFSWRASWTALTFTIGDGTVIKGFNDGVLGLSTGQSATIVAPPADAYGAANPALVFVHPLLESVPARTVWNDSAFVGYFKATPVSGGSVTDPVWGWTDTVTIEGGLITATASPSLGQAILPYGAWDAQVTSIDYTANNGVGVILVQHRLDATMVDRIGGTGTNGQKFYLSAVDVSGGTYTLNYNRQVFGRTLVFQITLAHISRLA